jgi:hypothetical protein
LVEVMVFCKLRPPTLEVLFAIAVVPNLHFVWSSDCLVDEGDYSSLFLGNSPCPW